MLWLLVLGLRLPFFRSFSCNGKTDSEGGGVSGANVAEAACVRTFSWAFAVGCGRFG